MAAPAAAAAVAGARALFRALLREHRQLPASMRELGDAYVKAEFRAVQNVQDEGQLRAFRNEWEKYLETLQLRRLSRQGPIGADLDRATRNKLSDEQRRQLAAMRESVEQER